MRWFGEAVDKPTREYLTQVAQNISLRGIFIETGHPPPAGTLIRLDIRLTPADPKPVHAKGIVRWRRRWSQPRGMGVEFLDFKGLGERDLREWLASVLGEGGREAR